MYFTYSEAALAYLKSKDKRLGEVIDRIGPVYREVSPALFPALVHSIVGQQISTKAQATIWRRITEDLGEVTPETICACSEERLQAHGLTFKKVNYMRGAAEKVLDGSLDLQALHSRSDAEVAAALSALEGVGVWTAEMLMLFSMQRQDIFSYGDLAIHRGLRMLYHHKKVSRALFEKYRRRYSPYGSVASLYLWAIAGDAIEGMRDYAPERKQSNGR